MNVSLMSQKIKERLAMSGRSKVGSTVQYVNVNDLSQFVPMPDWFKEITSLPGVPFKFIAEFSGPPDSGKTTAGMIALINAQKAGHVAILVDVERKFSFTRFIDMGGDPDQLFVVSEKSIEKTFSALEQTIKDINDECPEAKILVVYDSIAAGVSEAEMEKDADSKQTIADRAKVVKRMLQRQLFLIQDCEVAMVLINQIYADPNPMAHGKARISGGKGVEYSKSLGLSFNKRGDLPPKTVQGKTYKVGIITSVKTTKNHLQSGAMVITDLLLEVRAADMVVVDKDKKKKKGKGKDVPVELDDMEDTVETEEAIED